MMDSDQLGSLHPANAEELVNIAEETGADVLRGPLGTQGAAVDDNWAT